jgi:hypothetical protein
VSGRLLHVEEGVSGPGEPDLVCAGRPLVCPRCQVPLVTDPTGPWCRRCRRAWPGSRAHTRCPNAAIATGNTSRTRGLRLCRAHARLLVDASGPGTANLDAITALAERLADIRTPPGPTPNELGSAPAFISLTTLTGALTRTIPREGS